MSRLCIIQRRCSDALPVSKAPKKAPAAKDTSGTAQLASWEKVLAVSGVGAFAAERALVMELLDLPLRRQLYASYDDHFGGLRLSTTKSWLTRKGCIEIRPVHTYDHIQDGNRKRLSVTTRCVVRHEALNHDSTNTEVRQEREIPIGPDGLPDATALEDALTTMLSTQLGVVDNVADAGVVDSH